MRHQELASFLSQNLHEPQLNGSRKESLLARWLQNQRAYFKRTGNVCSEYEEYLDKCGYHGILRRSKQESASNNKTRLILEWMKLHGTEPKAGAEDQQEAYVGAILGRRRSKGQFFPSDVEMASSYGYPNLFENRNRESLSNQLAIKFCRWLKEHGGKVPDRRSEDADERMVSNWFWNRRSIALGNTVGHIYESDNKILDAFGFSRIFNNLR